MEKVFPIKDTKSQQMKRLNFRTQSFVPSMVNSFPSFLCLLSALGGAMSAAVVNSINARSR